MRDSAIRLKPDSKNAAGECCHTRNADDVIYRFSLLAMVVSRSHFRNFYPWEESEPNESYSPLQEQHTYYNLPTSDNILYHL
jgi:hypothetical protein